MKKFLALLKRHRRTIGIALVVVFIAIQFFRPAKNQSSAPSGHEVTQLFPVPDNVMATLKASCYDCHSNNTAYPWYNNVQPVAWWLSNHVHSGKRALNFDEFTTVAPNRQFKRLQDIQKQIREDEMPLSSYTLIHRYAILSDAQKKDIIDWAAGAEETMKAKYPADSLKMPPRKR